MTDDLDEPFFADSRYAIPREQALEDIKKRKAELLKSAVRVSPPEPDLQKREAAPLPQPPPLPPPPPEPTLTEREASPILFDPDAFAQQFTEKRKKPPQKSPHPRTRKPKDQTLRTSTVALG
jgi:hypothetical protein